MINYLALRIEVGALNYSVVVTKYPQFKTDIDTKLITDGYEHLIV